MKRFENQFFLQIQYQPLTRMINLNKSTVKKIQFIYKKFSLLTKRLILDLI